MKSHNETINSVFKRINEYNTMKQRRRSLLLKTVPALCSIPILIILLVIIIPNDIFNFTPQKNTENNSIMDNNSTQNSFISENNSTQNSDCTTNPNDVGAGINKSDPNIIWGTSDDSAESYGRCEWNNKTIAANLYDVLNANTNSSSIFAISMRFEYYDEQYVYKNKTIATYLNESEKAKQYHGRLGLLSKMGDYLKYGETLYITGAPDGEKWAKSFYDKTVSEIGEDILSKYIVDGIFLKEQLEADINSYNVSDVENNYREACAAYMQHILSQYESQLLEQNISYECPKNAEYIIIYVSSEEFASLSLDNMDKLCFYLATRNNDDGTDLDRVETY